MALKTRNFFREIERFANVLSRETFHPYGTVFFICVRIALIVPEKGAIFGMDFEGTILLDSHKDDIDIDSSIVAKG